MGRLHGTNTWKGCFFFSQRNQTEGLRGFFSTQQVRKSVLQGSMLQPAIIAVLWVCLCLGDPLNERWSGFPLGFPFETTKKGCLQTRHIQIRLAVGSYGYGLSKGTGIQIPNRQSKPPIQGKLSQGGRSEPPARSPTNFDTFPKQVL